MKLQRLDLIVNARRPLAEAHVNLPPLLMEEEKPFLTFSFQMLYGHLSLGYTKQELEKAMAPHSSTLAWKIPWTEEPGRLQSMGSLRAGRD